MFRETKQTLNQLSPSSRRAWIEMPNVRLAALVKKSPSSRRAWIEIEEDQGV